jgi:hypothetical protein
MAKCPLGLSRLPRLERLGDRFLWKQRATFGERRRERILSEPAAHRCELLVVSGLLLEGAGRPDRLSQGGRRSVEASRPLEVIFLGEDTREPLQ